MTVRCGEREFKDIQAIIFDKDGTLEDSRAYWHEVAIGRIEAIEARVPGLERSLELAFGISGHTLAPMGLTAVGSRRENEIAAAALIATTGRDWWSSLSIARSAFQEVDRRLPRPLNPLYPQVFAVIRDLATAGLSLAILSADTTARVEDFVKKNGLSPYIAVAWGSDRRWSKPDPRLAIETCTAMGISIERTLMVGDAVGDWEMARQAGCAGSIGIRWDSDSIGDLPEVDVMISTLTAITLSVRSR